MNFCIKEPRSFQSTFNCQRGNTSYNYCYCNCCYYKFCKTFFQRLLLLQPSWNFVPVTAITKNFVKLSTDNCYYYNLLYCNECHYQNNRTIIINSQRTIIKSFMKKVPVWNYANLNKEDYLTTFIYNFLFIIIRLSYDDKEKIIKQYYFDIKSRGAGEFESICCLLCLWDKLGWG